jgi:hypothetical protein
MYMKMELNNAGGVKVEDLIVHLEEFGRMPDGGEVVGMSLVALCVTWAFKSRLKREGLERRRREARMG